MAIPPCNDSPGSLTALDIEVGAKPCPVSISRGRLSHHSFKITNNRPGSIYSVEISAKATFSNFDLNCIHNIAVIRSGKTGSKSQQMNATGAEGSSDEIATTILLYDETQRDMLTGTFSGSKEHTSLSYGIDITK